MKKIKIGPLLKLHTGLLLFFSAVITQTGIIGSQYMLNAEDGQSLSFVFSIGQGCAWFISLLLGLALARRLRKHIIEPVEEMEAALSKIAQGDFDMAGFSNNNNDEIGSLGRNLSSVLDTIKSLINDINFMADRHKAGDIDVYIDADKYCGEFKKVASGVNENVQDYIRIEKLCITCLNEFALGNFNAPMEDLPGKRSFVSNGINDIRRIFKQIVLEIDSMVKEAIEGNLSVKADADKFKNDWAVLMSNLNNLLSEVTTPVLESTRVLEELAKGNLKINIVGQYKGDHAILTTCINQTVTVLSSYIGELSYVLKRISEKDLNVSITRDYVGDFSTLKDSVNLIATNLNCVISDINASSIQVANNALQIAETSQNLLKGSTSQAASIEELTALMDAISEKTSVNTETATSTNQLSQNAKDDAQKGSEQMDEMLNSMNAISGASNNITKIIKVIEDIAFQTNLLALNAAVEAARAGEHGKGFSVVAEEVRSLAARSQAAVKDTTQLIQEALSASQEGAEITNRTAEDLKAMVNKVNQVSIMANKIEIASKEQVEAIKQANTGIQQIAVVTQNNTISSEREATAAQNLSSQSEILREMVAGFNV